MPATNSPALITRLVRRRSRSARSSQRDQHGEADGQHRERDGAALAVGGGERGGLGGAHLLDRGQDRRPHELRRAAQVGLAQREAEPVQRAGVLDQPRVDGQLPTDRGDRRDRRVTGRQQPGRPRQPLARALDVVVVAGAHGGGLQAAGDVAGGCHRVGVGERLVEVGRSVGELRDPGAGVVHGVAAGHPAQHAEHAEDQTPDHQDDPDAPQPLGCGRAAARDPPKRWPDGRAHAHDRPPRRTCPGDILAQR